MTNGLLGGAKLAKNLNTSYYKYSGYGIAFDSGGSFTFGNINNGKYVIIFGVNAQNSIHSTNKTQNIYVMGKDFVQGIKIQQSMQKRFIRPILQNIVKSLFYHYTIMVVILIYLLMELNS